MPEQQVDQKPNHHVPGETALKEQLEAIRKEVVKSSDPAADDPIARAKTIVVDNYNEFRDKSKMPALTTELMILLWFNGNRSNWKAVLEASIVHGLRYEVSFNAKRNEAFVDVYRKINNVRINF